MVNTIAPSRRVTADEKASLERQWWVVSGEYLRQLACRLLKMEIARNQPYIISSALFSFAKLRRGLWPRGNNIVALILRSLELPMPTSGIAMMKSIYDIRYSILPFPGGDPYTLNTQNSWQPLPLLQAINDALETADETCPEIYLSVAPSNLLINLSMKT